MSNGIFRGGVGLFRKFFIPVKPEGQTYRRADAPAYCPSPAHAAEAPAARDEYIHERDPSNKVGERAYGKAEIAAATAHSSVGNKFYPHHGHKARNYR